jgi:hypothetical protein
MQITDPPKLRYWENKLYSPTLTEHKQKDILVPQILPPFLPKHGVGGTHVLCLNPKLWLPSVPFSVTVIYSTCKCSGYKIKANVQFAAVIQFLLQCSSPHQAFPSDWWQVQDLEMHECTAMLTAKLAVLQRSSSDCWRFHYNALYPP